MMPKTLALVLAVAVCSSCAGPAASARATLPETTEVAIVGGGIAGLVAAYELERLGISVQLIELSDRLGGRIATAHYGPGLSADYGMQEIWSKSPLAQLARELGLGLEGEGAFSSVVLEGKLHPYTQETAEAYLRSLFSADEYAAFQRWTTRAESLWTELHASGLTARLAPLNEASFADWLGEEKLPPRVAAFIRLTLECELGASAESFSAASGLAEFRVFLFGQETALHVTGGSERLVKAFAERIRGPRLLGARVFRIERRGGKATVSFLKDNQAHQVTADKVMLAVPWMVLHSIQLDPPLPPEAWQSLITLGRGQYTVVHLIVDKKIHRLWDGVEARPFPVLTNGPLGVIYGVAEPSPASQPSEVFSLLIHSQAARAFHLVPQEQKRIEVVAELEKLWPGFSQFVQNASIYPYHPAAIPFWPAGRSPFDEKARLLFGPFEGLYLAGDYLVSSHSEGAVVAAQRQAKAIAAELRPSTAAAP